MLDRRQKLYVTTLSFFKSQHTLLLVDIQGARWGLFDREIATAAILMEIPYYFAFALKNLFNDHVCNDLSVLLNLPDH